MKGKLLIVLILLAFSVPSIRALLTPGGFTSHDLTHHIVRQIDMDKLLREDQFPPRWSGDLNQGYGYPLFIFIYPAPALVGEVFHLLGLNFVESVKAVLNISMLISAIGMYLFLESLFPRQRMAAFLGAMFYLYAPVRFLNVYVSAAVGNALALGILPFVFWAIVKIYQEKSWGIPVGALLLSLVITSHNVTTLMFAPVILIFSLLLIAKSENQLYLAKKIFAMLVLSFGLSAFFWIPALLEKKFIVYDQILKNFWQDQFPTLLQLIHSPWGYGLSHPGVNEPGALSFQLGLAHIAVIGILSISIFIFRKKKDLVYWGLFCLVLFFGSVFLMQKASSPVWAHLPLLYLVQFPARFLAVAVFAASIASTLLIIYLPFKKIMFILLLAFVLYANRNHLRVNESFNPGESYYLSIHGTTTSANEHLPIWAYLPESASNGKLIFLEGEGKINILENKSAVVTAKIEAEKPSKLRFNQFYFPGWVLTDNGEKIDFNYLGTGENRGLPVFTINQGTHNFEAKFSDTLVRKFADVISIISLVILGFLLIQRVIRNPIAPTRRI